MRDRIYYVLILFLMLMFSSCKTTRVETIEGIKIESTSNNKYHHYEDGFVKETSVIEYYFDEEGELFRVLQPNIDQLSNGFEKIWDRIEKIIEYDLNNYVTSIKTYGYNNESDKELHKTTEIEYLDEKKKVIKVVNQNHTRDREYEYQIMIEKNNLRFNSKDSVVTVSYLLDDKNRVIQSLHRYKKSHVEIISETLTNYGEDTVKVYRKKHNSISEFIYSENKNVIERRNFQDDQIVSIQDFNYDAGFIKSSKIIGYPYVAKLEDGEDLEIYKSKAKSRYKIIVGRKKIEENERLRVKVNNQILGVNHNENSISDLILRLVYSRH